MEQHRENAIDLRTRTGTDALSHLALKHAAHHRDRILIVQNTEENLRRNIVRVIADDSKPTIENAVEVKLQEIAFDHLELGIYAMQIIDTLGVNLDDLELLIALHQKLSQHSHTRTDFKHRQRSTLFAIESLGNASGNTHIGKEMLSQRLLRLHLIYHIVHS